MYDEAVLVGGRDHGLFHWKLLIHSVVSDCFWAAITTKMPVAESFLW